MKHRPMMPLLTLIAVIAMLTLAIGCSETQDERLSHVVLETTTQQANQNRDITGLNREAADNHRRVVEAVEQLATGQVHDDNYGGRWGEPQQLNQFKQACAIEKAKIEARCKGNTVTEQALADGSVKLTIQVAS